MSVAQRDWFAELIRSTLELGVAAGIPRADILAIVLGELERSGCTGARQPGIPLSELD